MFLVLILQKGFWTEFFLCVNVKHCLPARKKKKREASQVLYWKSDLTTTTAISRSRTQFTFSSNISVSYLVRSSHITYLFVTSLHTFCEGGRMKGETLFISIVLYFLTLIIATARFICPNCSVRLVIFPSVFSCCYFLHLYIVVVCRSFCVDHGPCIYRQACCACVCVFFKSFSVVLIAQFFLQRQDIFPSSFSWELAQLILKCCSLLHFFHSSFHCIIHRHCVSVWVRTAETVRYCFSFVVCFSTDI